MTNLNKPETSPQDPTEKYPIGSTVKYRRENGEIIDLTVKSYDPVIDTFQLTGVVDDLSLELNMSTQTLNERSISAEEMNLKYPIGTEVGYKVRKMSDTGVLGPEITGEGTVYAFREGKYIVQMGDSFTPIKEDSLYKLDSAKGSKEQIKKTRTTLQGPFGKMDEK